MDGGSHEAFAFIVASQSDESSMKMSLREFLDMTGTVQPPPLIAQPLNVEPLPLQPAPLIAEPAPLIAVPAPLIAQPPPLQPAPSAEQQLVKVIQTIMKVNIVLRERTSGKFLTICSKVPLHLQCVDRTTAEALLSCYKEHLRAAMCHDIFGCFKYQVRVHTQDRCSANERMTNAIRREEAGSVHRLALGCDVHRVATVQCRVFELVGSHISGMIAVALAQRGGNKMAALRTIVGDVMLKTGVNTYALTLLPAPWLP